MTRSVNPSREADPNIEVGVIGYIVAAATFFLLLPLLPFIAIILIIEKLRGSSIERPEPAWIPSRHPALESDES